MIHVGLISDAELCAFLDGECPAQRAAEISIMLKQDGALQNKLDMWRVQKQALRARFAALSQEPMPDLLAQVLPLEPPVRRSPDVAVMRPGMRMRDEVLFWKRIALTLAALLFATSLYASGLVPQTQAPAPAPVLVPLQK
jgi:anti-sigma factor RsiW